MPTATPSLLQKLAAEFLGVFALVCVGCGALVVEAQTGRLGHVGVALSFGLDWPLGPSVVVVAAAFLPLGWGARLARRIRTG